MRPLLPVLLFAACTSGPTEPESADVFGAERETQSGTYLVSVAFDPDPPGMSDLFTARATLKDSAGVPIEDATVSLNATVSYTHLTLPTICSV